MKTKVCTSYNTVTWISKHKQPIPLQSTCRLWFGYYQNHESVSKKNSLVPLEPNYLRPVRLLTVSTTVNLLDRKRFLNTRLAETHVVSLHVLILNNETHEVSLHIVIVNKSCQSKVACILSYKINELNP